MDCIFHFEISFAIWEFRSVPPSRFHTIFSFFCTFSYMLRIGIDIYMPMKVRLMPYTIYPVAVSAIVVIPHEGRPTTIRTSVPFVYSVVCSLSFAFLLVHAPFGTIRLSLHTPPLIVIQVTGFLGGIFRCSRFRFPRVRLSLRRCIAGPFYRTHQNWVTIANCRRTATTLTQMYRSNK